MAPRAQGAFTAPADVVTPWFLERGSMSLDLRVNAHPVRIVLRDSGPTIPAPLAAAPCRIGQHCLEIVQAWSVLRRPLVWWSRGFLCQSGPVS